MTASIQITGTVEEAVAVDRDWLDQSADETGTVAVDDVLRCAVIDPTSTHCTAISKGGDYRASIPIMTMRSGGRLEVRQGGDPIPEEAGGPVRLRVVDGETLCWNVKSVSELRLSVGPLPDDVPENPPH